MSFVQKNIALKDLILWDENARFPDQYFNKEEPELIAFFLSKPDFKIQTLLEAIVKDFDLPQLEKIVVWENEGSYIVIEGNRRLTAYKLLNNPDLTSNKKLKTLLVDELKGKINITDNFSLECLVTEVKDECYRYIDRKHTKSNNEVTWQDTERALYNVRRGSKNLNELLKIGISKIVKALDLPDEMKDKILGNRYVTTFFRLITITPAKKEFGYAIIEDGSLTVKDPKFNEKLKVIINDVLKKKDFEGNVIDSRALNKADKIETYIKSVKAEDVKKVDAEIKKNTTNDMFGGTNINIVTNKKQIVLPKSSNRNHLIPSSCRLTIPETKINNIYIELKSDLLLDNSTKAVPNAVGVLFRVFIEISIDYFLEREGVNLSKDTKLAGKITKCSEILENGKHATKKQLENIRKVATHQNSILGIQNFHDYIHSYKSNPSSSDLISKWDNLEEFFQILWDYLATKKQMKKK